ncbi:MAG: GAF domain-containing protein [Deltaproteobacteria bacterium]|nr:GAF domain-containing protein [Deltaproteobacteria bacterium]
MNKDLITELEAEISRLKAELEKAREQMSDVENSRRAMLFMLEDLNKSTANVMLAKKEWEATFDAISAPLFIHDKEFKIVRTNRAYAEAAGAHFKEFIGKPYYEVFPKMEGPFKMCLKAQELQEEEEEEEFSYPITNSIFKVRFYPIKDGNGQYRYSIHIMEDITEAKKAEENMKAEMEITTHLLMIADATAHTTDVNKLMEQVAHCGHEIIKCDVCLSYVWNEDGQVFQPSQYSGLAHDMIPIFRTEPLDKNTEFVKKTMQGKEPVIISGLGDVAQTFRSAVKPEGLSYIKPQSAFPWLPGINTIAAIPLIGRTGYLGLLIAIYKNAKEFTQRDRKIMQGISNQVSTALEQARLYKETVNKSMELSHKVETIQVMNEIDRSILSTLEQQEILEITARLISRVIQCDRATIALVNKEKREFIYAAGFGITFLSKGQIVSFDDTNATEVIETGRPQYVSNIAEVKDLPLLEKKFLDHGFLSHIRVPLVVKNVVIGVLSIGSKRPSAFTKQDLATLEKIASQISVALENARLVTDLNELFIGTVRSLSSAIDAKSPWTAGHSERVTKYAIEIAKGMGFDEKALKDLELAGLLHDVGKIGTYETILDKPGKLTEDELKIIRQHPVKGVDILAHIKQLKDIIPAIKYHHEFYDGTGYPDGLKGEEIPLFARILTVADTVDAMGADRPYRKGRPMDAITAELKRCSGTQFDPKVVEVFLGMKR